MQSLKRGCKSARRDTFNSSNYLRDPLNCLQREPNKQMKEKKRKKKKFGVFVLKETKTKIGPFVMNGAGG